jgi:hypothetical protein
MIQPSTRRRFHSLQKTLYHLSAEWGNDSDKRVPYYPTLPVSFAGKYASYASLSVLCLCYSFRESLNILPEDTSRCPGPTEVLSQVSGGDEGHEYHRVWDTLLFTKAEFL